MKPYRIEGAQDLRLVADSDAFHKVTVYVPVDAAPSQRHASELRLRGAFDRACERLRERDVRESEVEARRARLEEARPALDDLHPAVRTVVWLGDEEGWARAALVDELPERIAVSNEFALRPLIRALERDRRFRVVLISGNRVAAFVGDARELRPIEVEDLPESLEDALGSQVEGEGVSYRSDHPVPGRASNAPIYHGHGGASAERSVDRERFAQAVARALDAAWAGDDLPVVLAGEVRTASELRSHLKLPHLLDDDVRGNFEAARPEELHARAWECVQAALGRDREPDRAAAYEQARNVGKSVEGDFDAVGEAAVAGRIRRLWVEEQARCPGRFDWRTGRRQAAEDAEEDALDGLVAQVIRRGGEVHVVDADDLPAEGPCCAELR